MNANTIQVHPWELLPCGAQSYCHAPNTPDGWCVYTRIETPNDPQQPFDIIDEEDFATLPEALAAAYARSKRIGYEVEEY
jgi:hypothetical protein